MDKYWSIFKASWQQNLMYRLNFSMWRIRSVIQLLLIYYIWWTVFKSHNQVLGYTQSSILTYVLVAALIRAIVLSTRVTDLIDAINNGSIVNFLIKPLGLIKYLLTRDVADKLFNILFYVFEVSILIFLLKPQIIIQTNVKVLLIVLLALIGGLVIYFCINLIISLTAFWLDNSWGPLFLMSILLESLGGGLFPIDIFPKQLFNGLMLTPFPYLIYFPTKLYLGNVDIQQILLGFSVIFVWVVLLMFIVKIISKAGFRHFSAVGN